jgi:hypothetical protein
MDPLGERGETMTPLLVGRWETRLLLFAIAGSLVTLLYSLPFGFLQVRFIVLGYVLLFGFVWDALYQFILSYRWDQDWPTFYQVLAGIWEGLFVWLLIKTLHLPGIPANLSAIQFFPHYALVWLSIFVISQGPIRTVFVGWRYRGGQWL